MARKVVLWCTEGKERRAGGQRAAEAAAASLTHLATAVVVVVVAGSRRAEKSEGLKEKRMRNGKTWSEVY